MAIEALKSCRDAAKETHSLYNRSHGLTNSKGECTRAGKMNVVSGVMMVALLAIGVLAITGIMPTAAASWTAVGLGGATLVTQMLGGKLKNRKVDLLIAAVFAAGFVAAGALTATGFLTGAQLGYSLVGIVGTYALFNFCCGRAYAARSVQQSRSFSTLGQSTV